MTDMATVNWQNSVNSVQAEALSFAGSYSLKYLNVKDKESTMSRLSRHIHRVHQLINAATLTNRAPDF